MQQYYRHMGRVQLSVRVKPEQKAALERLAQRRSIEERRKVDVSEVVRELIDKETRQKEAGELPML